MAASLNRVIIMGNLGQDPELRYTANKTPVCSLNVATTEYRTNQEGQKQDITEWHRVVVWSRMAENCAKYLAKGRTVMIEGRLQTRSWEDQQGQKRYTTEIVASNVQFVGGRDSTTSNEQYSSQPQNNNTYNNAPTNNQDRSTAPQNNNMDDDIGEIPF